VREVDSMVKKEIRLILVGEKRCILFKLLGVLFVLWLNTLFSYYKSRSRSRRRHWSL